MYRQEGFTILEVVVAFSILCLVTIVCVGIVTQNSINVEKLKRQIIAMEVIENAIAEINESLSSGAVVQKTYSGEQKAGYKWLAEVSEYGSGENNLIHNRVLPLWKVVLVVFEKNKQRKVMSMTIVVPGK